MEDWENWFTTPKNVAASDIRSVAKDAKHAEQALDALSAINEEDFDANEIKGVIADVQRSMEADSEHIGDLSVKLDTAIAYSEFLIGRLSRMLDAYKAMGVSDNDERNVEEIAAWCEENMPETGWYWMHLTEDKRNAVFLFDNETDAVHFKMRWG